MKQEVKLTVKLLAFVMALLILIVSLPVSVLASAISEETGDTSIDNISTNADMESESTAKDVIVLEEDEALREENIKHFKLSDGTTKAVVYSQAVHYKDADGKWVDIDNALTLNGSEYSAGNKSEIKFANKSGSSGLVSIKDGGYKIDFTPLNTNKVSAVIENPQSSNSRKFEDMSVLNNLVSKAIYENIYDGIDIEYILVGNNIKENIIVKEKQDTYTFSFELKLNKLSAELVNGAVILSDYDSGEQVYEIPAPYMLDANNAYSNRVEYTLTQNSKWKYTLTVTANANWINAEERTFPVTIDPTVGVNKTWVHDSSYGYSDEHALLYVSQNVVTDIEIDLPSFPQNVYITSAKLKLYSCEATGGYVGAYINGETTPIDYRVVSSINTLYTWEILEAVEAGMDEYCASIELKSMAGGESSFYSINNNDANVVPVFEVSYIDMKGLESYWLYTSHNVGNAGMGSVNLATGNLVFSVGTLSTTDGLFSFNPTLVYNSALAGKSYERRNALVGYTEAFTGNGWKLNVQETIIKKTYKTGNRENVSYYIWADSDGTEHSFFETEENVYLDEDGLQLTLFVNNNVISLTDSNFNVKYFTKVELSTSYGIINTWCLSSIEDKNGNKISFDFENFVKPINVKVIPNGSSAIEMLSLKYNDDGILYLVWNRSNKKATLLRYSDTPTGTLSANGGAYLREILYLTCDNTVTEDVLYNFIGDTDNNATGITVDAIAKYEYDSSGKLICANDTLSEYSVRYTYNNKKVQCIREHGAENVWGKEIPIEYYSGYTEVIGLGRDDYLGPYLPYGDECDDVINVYCFDTWGRVESAYSMNNMRNKIYGATTREYESENDKSKNSLNVSTVINSNSANYLVNGNFEASDTSVPNWTITGENYLNGTTYGVAWNNGKLNLYVNANGTASALQTVKLSNGTYTLSLDIEAYSSNDMDIYLIASSETRGFSERVSVNETYAAGNNAFTSFTFKVTETEPTDYEIGVLVVGNANATNLFPVTIDNLMLSKTTGTSPYNYINYADMESGESGTFEEVGKWYLSNLAVIEDTETEFGNSIKINGSILEKRSASQRIYTASSSALSRYQNNASMSGATSTPSMFTISGFGKADSIMKNNRSVFAIGIKIICCTIDNNGELVEAEQTKYAAFANNKDNWQYASATFVLPSGSMVKSIDVFCEYSYNVGVAYFDNLTLTCNDGESTTVYTYYKNGKLRSSHTGVNNFAFYAYENGDLTTVISPRQMIEYGYNDKHNITSEKYYTHTLSVLSEDVNVCDLVSWCEQNRSLKMMAYNLINAYGLVVHNDIHYEENGEHIITNYLYETTPGHKNFGVLIKTSEGIGTETEYYYYSDGKLGCIVNDDGTGYYYSYNATGNLTGVNPVSFNDTFSNYYPDTSSSYVQFEYGERNELKEITTAGGTEYSFGYDNYGNLYNILIGNSPLLERYYRGNNGKLSYEVYANGITVDYHYDELNRVYEIEYEKGSNVIATYEYEYDSNGNICKFTDSVNDSTTIYKYDSANRLVKMIEYDNEEMKNKFGVSYEYDSLSRIENHVYYQDYIYSGSNSEYMMLYYGYTYNDNTDSTLSRLNIYLDGMTRYSIGYFYDNFGRSTNRVTELGAVTAETSYEYLTSGQLTTMVITSYTTEITKNSTVVKTDKYNYTYDETYRNITEVRDANGNLLYKYTYDSLDRLVREDNSVTNKTYVYTYDNNGNILEEEVYSYTTGIIGSNVSNYTNLYTYNNSNWKDQLTSFCGNTITYDSMGNPLRYYNGMEFTWSNINNLTSINDWGMIYTYTYNDNGIRTSKTISGVKHTYHLEGTKIRSESYGDSIIVYIYDESDSIIGMAYRNSSYASGAYDSYLFTKNLQGDIMGIYDTNGNCVASYTYNAWGEHTVTNYTSANIGNINPFRYRGYYYDTETGFYYLNARYYDPQIKRFINPDTLDNLGANGDLNAYNLYAYCSNNPVMYVDPMGDRWYDVIIGLLTGSTILRATEAEIGIGIGIGIGGSKGKIEAYRDNTLYFHDGEFLLGNSVSAEASISKFGIGSSHNQYTSGDSEEIHCHSLSNNVFEDAQQIIECPQCNHDSTLSFNGKGTSFKDPTSIGVGVSGHFIIGGHASAKFSPFKVLMVILEDWQK